MGKKIKGIKGKNGLNHLMRLPTAALFWNTGFRGPWREGSNVCKKNDIGI